MQELTGPAEFNWARAATVGPLIGTTTLKAHPRVISLFGNDGSDIARNNMKKFWGPDLQNILQRLKVKPYDAIQICLLLLLFFYTPGSIDPRG